MSISHCTNVTNWDHFSFFSHLGELGHVSQQRMAVRAQAHRSRSSSVPPPSCSRSRSPPSRTSLPSVWAHARASCVLSLDSHTLLPARLMFSSCPGTTVFLTEICISLRMPYLAPLIPPPHLALLPPRQRPTRLTLRLGPPPPARDPSARSPPGRLRRAQRRHG